MNSREFDALVGERIDLPLQEQEKRIALLFSGGIDSTVALWFLKSRGFDSIAIQINYKGRPPGEKVVADSILRTAAVKSISVNLEALDAGGQMISMLNRSAMLLISICDAICAELRIPNMVFGTIQEDWRNGRNSQASHYYFNTLQNMLKLHRPESLRVFTPFRSLNKSSIVKLGLLLGAPVTRAWSCVASDDNPCGECWSCREAQTAINSAI